MCSLKHARYVIPVLTSYAIYSVAVRVGWLGVFLTLNLSFLTNDLLNKLVQGYEGSTEESQFEDMKDSDPVMDEFYRSCEFPPVPDSEPETVSSAKPYCSAPIQDVLHVQKEEPPSKVVKSDSSSLDEIKRIMDGSNHYEVLGVPRNRSIDQKTLKKEYHRMVLHHTHDTPYTTEIHITVLFYSLVFCFSRSYLYTLIKIWEIHWPVNHLKSFNQLMRQVFGCLCFDLSLSRLLFSPVLYLFFITFLILDEVNLCSHTSLQVLSDFTKKNSYDEQLRKEELQRMTPRSRVVSQQVVSYLCCIYIWSSIEVYSVMCTEKLAWCHFKDAQTGKHYCL